ncbi:hypothetical protein ACT691_05405 [Vibrio metschnikovii]
MAGLTLLVITVMLVRLGRPMYYTLSTASVFINYDYLRFIDSVEKLLR